MAVILCGLASWECINGTLCVVPAFASLFELFLKLFGRSISFLSKEKWDSSGGNEALGRASAAIPESTRQMVGSLFKREQIRGPGVCFGIGEERPFYVEKTPSLLVERLRHNMTFFYLNYTILTGVLFCLTLLVSPSAIIGIGILAVVWFWLIKASQDGSLRVGCK